jgi:hypothetical protein
MMSEMAREQMILIFHRELESMPCPNTPHRVLRKLLEKIMLPILALFPEFSLGVHYLGKAFGMLIRVFERLSCRT